MIGGQQIRPRWQQSLSQEALWAIDRASSGWDLYGNRLTPEEAQAVIDSYRIYSAEPHNNERTIRPNAQQALGSANT